MRVKSVRADAQTNTFNNCHSELSDVILNLFQNLWIATSNETLKQVQGDSMDAKGSNTWFGQQRV